MFGHLLAATRDCASSAWWLLRRFSFVRFHLPRLSSWPLDGVRLSTSGQPGATTCFYRLSEDTLVDFTPCLSVAYSGSLIGGCVEVNNYYTCCLRSSQFKSLILDNNTRGRWNKSRPDYLLGKKAFINSTGYESWVLLWHETLIFRNICLQVSWPTLIIVFFSMGNSGF